MRSERGTIIQSLLYEVEFISSLYPSESSWNGNELYASLTHSILTAKVTRGTSGSVEMVAPQFEREAAFDRQLDTEWWGRRAQQIE